MRVRNMKKIIPILLVVGLCGGYTASFAEEHGKEKHPAEQAVVHDVHDRHTQSIDDSAKDQAEHPAPVAEAHGADDHAEAAGEHYAPMITAAKLKDLFWRALNFAALVFILVKFLAKPITAGLGGRRQEIKDELETIQQQRDEAEQAYKAFESRLAGMEDELTELVDKAKAMAEDEKTRILAEAEASAKEIRRQAEAAVQGTFAQAKSRLQAEIAEQAVAMAEELIVKNLTPEDQVAITEQYLERVGAVQ
uniref:F0F1 ATP synthase subunit B family protein n=2 Tax=Candidatus Electrothrix sp. TaxID=2170559 RepID=UPI004056E4DC